MKQPAPVYQRIAGHQWRHIWLSGDIHGCLEQLRRKLWHCRFDPWRDLLISVGDVIDRGPQSLRCLQLLEQQKPVFYLCLFFQNEQHHLLMQIMYRHHRVLR